MKLKFFPVLVGAVLAFGAGTIWGIKKKPLAEVGCSILLQPKMSDAKSALAELASDAGSPMMVLKGTMESHTLLSKVASSTGVSEISLEKNLQVKPIAKEMRVELSYKNPDKDLGLRVLNSVLIVLNLQTQRLSESFGTQQAAGLKALIDQRVKELNDATTRLAEFQKSFKSGLDPVKARQSVFALRRKYELAKSQLDVYTKQQAQRLANPELGDWNPGLQKLRLEKEKAENELKLALVKYGDENPEVLALRQRLRIAQQAFSDEVSRIKQSEQKNLVTQSALLRGSIVSLEQDLKLAEQNEQLSADEALNLAKLKAEVETVTLVLKGLRASYEQARITGAGTAGTWAVLDAPYVLPEPTMSEKILKYGGLALFGYLGLIVLFQVFRFGVSQRGAPRED
ncbi:MAG: hypothetical protein WCK51_04660 [Armatimonadota bacterium]